MKENLISISFTPEEKTTVSDALAAIEGVLKNKNMVNLSPEERQQYARINNRTENWIKKVVQYMEQKPEFTPFYVNKDELDADMGARSFMENTLTRLSSVLETLDDTSKLLSTDVYNTAIAYYRNIKLISQQNVPGTTSIYQDLASQFPGRPSSVPEEADGQE